MHPVTLTLPAAIGASRPSPTGAGREAHGAGGVGVRPAI